MSADIRITYIGHATLLLEIDGVHILTDPILRDRVVHLKRRSMQVQASDYQNVDVVLISHLHWDHMDIPSLRMIRQDFLLIVPLGAAGFFSKQGFNNVKELSPGEEITIGRLTIEATHAEHRGSFLPFGPYTNCLGFLIKGSQTIYFAGDTNIFPEMANLAEHLDVALIPVWGWGPTLGKGHMDPIIAAQALTLLRPRIAIPIHWGTFYPRWLSWLRPYLLTDPPHIFMREAKVQAPLVNVKILNPGSSLTLPIE